MAVVKSEGKLFRELQLLGCVAGIYSFYLMFGYFQENMYEISLLIIIIFPVFIIIIISMSKKWGEKEERFNYTSFLLMIQSIINAACAGLGIFSPLLYYIYLILSVIMVTPLNSGNTPFHKYAWVSLSSILAMFCSNRALLYVDYPTQVLAKSCKSIPGNEHHPVSY